MAAAGTDESQIQAAIGKSNRFQNNGVDLWVANLRLERVNQGMLALLEPNHTRNGLHQRGCGVGRQQELLLLLLLLLRCTRRRSWCLRR